MITVAILSHFYPSYYYHFTGDANSIFALIVSISLFGFFLNCKINHNKYINLFGGAAFGVLLIHSNCKAMRELIFIKIIDTQTYYLEGNWLVPIISCLLIYLICGAIEILRQKFVEKPLLNVIYRFCSIN